MSDDNYKYKYGYTVFVILYTTGLTDVHIIRDASNELLKTPKFKNGWEFEYGEITYIKMYRDDPHFESEEGKFFLTINCKIELSSLHESTVIEVFPSIIYKLDEAILTDLKDRKDVKFGDYKAELMGIL